MGDILTTEKEKPPTNKVAEHYPFMTGVNFVELDDPTVSVILDVRHAWTWAGGETKSGSRDEPIALKTKWGWTFLGAQNKSKEKTEPEPRICLIDSEKLELENMINHMFRHEFIMSGDDIAPPDQIHPSVKDNFSLKQMEESIVFDETIGHYKVALPWREGRDEAIKVLNKVNSYENAKMRLLSEKKKLLKDPARLEGVFGQFEDSMKEGHIREVTVGNPENCPQWRMPLLVVTRPDKPGKFRLCQDAASKVENVYLNQHLCIGPDNLNSLVGVLLRSREKPVIVTGDIKGFFHQIRVDDPDVSALRFLFFKDRTLRDILEFESPVHIFGASSSPPVANFTLKYHAHRIREKYGEAIFWQIMNSFYVDDFIASFEDVETARAVRMGVTKALAEGGFELCKFSSSHPEVLNNQDEPAQSVAPLQDPETFEMTQKIALEASESPGDPEIGELFDSLDEGSLDNLAKELIQMGQTSSSKILGLGWDKETDMYYVRVPDNYEQKTDTRRKMLKLVASIYDPVGLAAPYILKGRIIMQRTCELELGWDQKLPVDIQNDFDSWKSNMAELNNIRVPRWISTEFYKNARTDLIGFCDASFEGYGVAFYARKYFHENDEGYATLIRAKARVVPKSMHKNKIENQENHNDSIPRLELNAARLAAKMMREICKESGIKFDKKIILTDSATILTWINDPDKKYKTFEAFRLNTIRELTDPDQWRHCPTKDNPADHCTHGLNATDKEKWCQFISGPAWLSKGEDQWPPVRPLPKRGAKKSEKSLAKGQSQPREPTPDEVGIAAMTPDEGDDWIVHITKKKSEWENKVVAVARAIEIFRKFFSFLKNKKEGRRNKKVHIRKLVSNEGFKEAEKLLIKNIQLTSFQTEVGTLLDLEVRSPETATELRSKSSRITSLNPFIDQEGFLRVGGRLGKAENLPYEVRFPAILPARDERTNALIRHEHEKLAHSGVNHVFHSIRKRFHILGGRNTISSVISKCTYCQMNHKRIKQQKMGSLPEERVTLVKPFQATAIDVCGPFHVRHGGRGTTKRWILVESCMATRAISLHPLKDMSTPTLINALVKLKNTFPGVETIYSDNGTNFRGADRELKDAVKRWNNEQTEEDLRKKEITWKWSPPQCPHYGGVWERIVQSVKKTLKAIIGDEVVDLDVFETALTSVSAILNSRPLTKANDDTEDFQTLSPSDFLYPYLINSSQEILVPPTPLSGEGARSSWKKARTIVEEWRTRWIHEYLLTLRNREKWKTSQTDIPDGTIVIIEDKEVPRLSWKKGRVVRRISGQTYEIRDPKGSLMTRHFNQLVPLELD